MDTSFPFLSLGWSVAVQDGQYRAVWYGLVGPWRGFSRETRDGPGGRVNSGTTDPAGRGGGAYCPSHKEPTGMSVNGGACAWLWLVSKLMGFPPSVCSRDNRRTHVLAQPVAGQMDRVVRDSLIGMGGSLPSLFTPVSGARRSGRGMQPAG